MQKRSKDHAFAVIKAGLAGVPYIGGSIVSLINDYVPSATQRTTEEAIEMLRQRIEERQDRIDPELVNKDEFSELFKLCYLVIVRTHQKSKLRAAANLLANILLKDDDPEKLTYTELDHFVRCVDSLSIGAIQVLGCIVEIVDGRRLGDSGWQHERLDAGQLRQRLPELAPDLLMGLLGELNSFHLVHLVGAPMVRVMPQKYDNYPLELPRIGYDFVVYVLGENAEE